MAEYDYLVIDASGNERAGRVAAPSVEDARARLVEKKLYVVRVAERDMRAPAAQALLSPGRWQRRMGAKQLSLFTRQLATLVRVTPLEESLRTIAAQTEAPHAARAISAVHTGVFEGRRLAEAMAREPKSFPPLYRATIAAGESTGSLPTILERLAELLERQAAIRSKIFSAIAYPIILAIVATLVVTSMMIGVVPKVVAQFDDVGQQLPLITRIVIFVSDVMANYWWAILIAIAAAISLFRLALRDPARALAFDAWLLRLPGIGRLIRDLYAARIARTLATMVASRLPLYEGLALTAQTVRNRALKAASEQIVEAIRGGSSLSTAMKRAGVFPPLLVYLAASGEAAGQLDTMLERAADYLEREFDSFTSAALSLLEPGIIVIMGGIVATIVLAILLPLLQLQSLAGI
jgi:general secretion pathway protein F